MAANCLAGALRLVVARRIAEILLLSQVAEAAQVVDEQVDRRAVFALLLLARGQFAGDLRNDLGCAADPGQLHAMWRRRGQTIPEADLRGVGAQCRRGCRIEARRRRSLPALSGAERSSVGREGDCAARLTKQAADHAQRGLLAVSHHQQVAAVLPSEYGRGGVLDGHRRAEPGRHGRRSFRPRRGRQQLA